MVIILTCKIGATRSRRIGGIMVTMFCSFFNMWGCLSVLALRREEEREESIRPLLALGLQVTNLSTKDLVLKDALSLPLVYNKF